MTVELILTENNLIELKGMKDGLVDHFIYDPLFNSNKMYVSTPDDSGNVQIMKDVWKGGRQTYLLDFEDRLREIHRILKPYGNVICHCDDTVGWDIYHSFINIGFYNRCTIIWSFAGGGISKHNPQRKHNYIHVFSKTNNKEKWVYNPIVKQYSESTKHVGKRSTYSGADPIPLEEGTPLTLVWDSKEEEFERKEALDNRWGWAFKPDFGPIKPVTGWARSSNSANTEKPIALYKRLVYLFTNKGDLIVDPYMGGGTTLIAAEELGRNSIGMDYDITAFEKTKNRLKANNIEFTTKRFGDINTNSDLFPPHKWGSYMISLDKGTPNPKKSDDGGVDGWNDDMHIVYQAKKHGKKIGPSVIRETHSVAIERMERLGWDDCIIKIISWVGFTPKAYGEAARIKRGSNSSINVVLSLGSEIEEFVESNRPLDINLYRKNGEVIVSIENSKRRIVKYTWVIKKMCDQTDMFTRDTNKEIIQTIKPVLNLSKVNIKGYNYLKCTVVDAIGNKYVKEIGVN